MSDFNKLILKYQSSVLHAGEQRLPRCGSSPKVG